MFKAIGTPEAVNANAGVVDRAARRLESTDPAIEAVPSVALVQTPGHRRASWISQGGVCAIGLIFGDD